MLKGPTKLLRPYIVCLVFLTHQSYAIDVIAHRGYACSDLENSLQSVERAWRAGADGVEVDVRVSGDGVVYLFHDDEISGTKLAGLPFSEIASLSTEPVTRLSDILKAENGNGYYVFDLKTSKPADVDVILSAVQASRLSASSVSFQSGSLDSLDHIRRKMPKAKLTYLSHLKWKIPYVLHTSAKQLVDVLDGHDIDRVSIKGRSFIDKEFVDTIKATGRGVHVWTINDPERAAFYRKLGADGLITDTVGEPFCDAEIISNR